MASNQKFPPSPIDRPTSNNTINTTERLNVLSTDETLRNNLADNDPIVQYKAATKFSNQAHAVMPSKQGLVQAGVVNILVRYLTDGNQVIQQEAISSITKIAAVSSEYAMVVVDENIVPILIDLLNSSNQDTSELSVNALGTIASGNPEARNVALDQQALPPLLTFIAHTTQHSSMLRSAAWALSNICGGHPPPPFEQVNMSIPTLVRLANSVDEEVIACACWSFASLTHEEKVSDSAPATEAQKAKIQTCIVDTRITKRLVDLLLHRSMAVQLPAVKTVGNMADGSVEQIQLLLENGVIKCLGPLLQSSRVQVRADACRAIGNLAKGATPQIQAIIDGDLIPKLVLLSTHDSVKVIREAISAFSNILKGTDDQVKYLVAEGCIQPLCDHVLASNSDANQVFKALDAIEIILEVGERIEEGKENPYTALFKQAGGLERFDHLQFHNNTQIHEKSNEILAKYFKPKK